MTTKYIQSGGVLDYPNASGSEIASDAVVVLTSGASGFIGVAQDSIPDGSTGAVGVDGVYELTALGTDTGAIGAVVYWDDTNKRITTTATANTRAGRLAKAKANGQTTAHVLLNAA